MRDFAFILYAECGHVRNSTNCSILGYIKIFCILTLGILKQIMCGKYGSSEKFLAADAVSKTLTNNRSRKFQETNVNKIRLSF